jgi:hypothetical protein
MSGNFLIYRRDRKIIEAIKKRESTVVTGWNRSLDTG